MPAKKSTTVLADPADIEQFMNECPEQYLMCRAGNHSWDWVTDHIGHVGDTVFLQEDACIHCGQPSFVPLSTSTFIQMGPRKPDYNEDYGAKGMGRMNSSEGRGIARRVLRERRNQRSNVRTLAAKKAAATRKKTAAASSKKKAATKKRTS